MVENRIFFSVLFMLAHFLTGQELKTNYVGKYHGVLKGVDSILRSEHWDGLGSGLRNSLLYVDSIQSYIVSSPETKMDRVSQLGPLWYGNEPMEISLSIASIPGHPQKHSMLLLPMPRNLRSAKRFMLYQMLLQSRDSSSTSESPKPDCSHLDKVTGRLLLRLELKALESAILSKSTSEKKKHVLNALEFRRVRHENELIKNAENKLEATEGIAAYKTIFLTTEKSKIKDVLIRNAGLAQQNISFSSSFSYVTIPMYGYLLSQIDVNWSKEISRGTNLTDYISKKFNTSESRKLFWEDLAKENKYGFQSIEKSEIQRDRKLRRAMKSQWYWYTQRPTLQLELKNADITFGYQNLIPFRGIGVLYPQLEIEDDWGILVVDRGAIILEDLSKTIVSAPMKTGKNKLSGRGWYLEMKSGWVLQRKGKHFRLSRRASE